MVKIDSSNFMRAVYTEGYGTPDKLVVGTFPKPVIGPGEILISVKAAGVAFHDGLQLAGKHQIKHEMPYVPGMEIAGEILELGDEVFDLKIGTRVMALHQGNAWGEFAKANKGQVWALPNSVDFVSAAAISMAYTTAYCGLYWEGKVKEGDTVLITGASGAVGLAAVDIAKTLGAKVIAVASSQKRIAIAQEYGADSCINYSRVPIKETVAELTGGKGADVAFDPVMGFLYPDILSSLGWGGRHVIIGFAGGEIPQIPSNRLLIKNRSALGVVLSYYRYKRPALMRETVGTLFKWYQEGRIRPHIAKTGPLEMARDFLNGVMQRKLIGRAILKL